MSTESKSTDLSSIKVRAGGRTYFFDVKAGPKGGLFLSISETAAKDGVFTRQKLLIFDSHIREFYDGLCESIRAIREEQKRREAAEVETVKPEARKKKAA